jgi:hypothetical protein
VHEKCAERSINAANLERRIVRVVEAGGVEPRTEPLFVARNLLIPQNGRNAQNGQNASLRYTAGTRISMLILPRADGGLRSLLARPGRLDLLGLESALNATEHPTSSPDRAATARGFHGDLSCRSAAMRRWGGGTANGSFEGPIISLVHLDLIFAPRWPRIFSWRSRSVCVSSGKGWGSARDMLRNSSESRTRPGGPGRITGAE